MSVEADVGSATEVAADSQRQSSRSDIALPSPTSDQTLTKP